MKLILTALIVLLAGCQFPQRPVNPEANVEDWIALFDGETLDGWIPKIRGQAAGVDSLNTFRVEDGVIKVDYSNYDAFKEQFGHLFYETPFSYYRLNVVYRFTGDQISDGPGWAYRNSGLMLHGQDPYRMGRDQDFPISIEVQLLGGDGTNERTTANLCTPGTNVVMGGDLVTQHCINAESPTFHGDDWVEVEVVVMGDSLVAHAVEGAGVLAYSKPQMGGGAVSGLLDGEFVDGQPLISGTISVQSESHPVEFQRIELLNLSGCRDIKALNYKSYFVHSEPDSCVYGTD